ncbi:mucin-associated surface protein (MASP), putative [Trypanosoma cruzi marinkellei]|uniref:Mucin-associated surface protein (MASP), putative n=1 Tax=Trypanosoma cruzi marinkellei TaxID=85056 RepID=K2M4T1_TRYCR|nr:mucin-associated surface protein (MASP), putative [Trypanosoma cruzi marinkellei]
MKGFWGGSLEEMELCTSRELPLPLSFFLSICVCVFSFSFLFSILGPETGVRNVRQNYEAQWMTRLFLCNKARWREESALFLFFPVLSFVIMFFIIIIIIIIIFWFSPPTAAEIIGSRSEKQKKQKNEPETAKGEAKENTKMWVSYSRDRCPSTSLPRSLSAVPKALHRQSTVQSSKPRRRGSRTMSVDISRRKSRALNAEEPLTESRRPTTARTVEYYLSHRQSRQPSREATSMDNQHRNSVQIVRSVLPYEIRALDSIELGLSNPGSLTLMKMLLPLEHANYPFNVHERRKPFLPGDAVAVKMGQLSMRVSFARVEDMALIGSRTFKIKNAPILVNSELIGEVKYSCIQHIDLVVPPGDAHHLTVRLSGVTGFAVHLCFSERPLCSVFVKLLLSHCNGHVTLSDEVGMFSSTSRSVVFELPQRSPSFCPVNWRGKSLNLNGNFKFPENVDQDADDTESR